MIFGTQTLPISEIEGLEIINYGKYLGRSDYEKDCCWACYQYNEKYYISLNSESDSVYYADKADIELYNEVPAES